VKRPATGPSTATLRSTLDVAPDGTTLVELAGAIDENSDLQGLFDRLTGDTILNMRRVERVNSMGVHGWVPLVNKFAQKHRLMIDEISYALVQSANSVANMFGAAYIRSCMAPYFCTTCQDNQTLTVMGDEVRASRFEPPARYCGRCKQPMEFDELDGYFGFFQIRTGK
jgi:hypothetical protein